MATCIAIRIGGDTCGRETEDNSDYCFIHRDLDWLRGAKDVRDYLVGGFKYLGYAHSALGMILIIISQYSGVPMARSILSELESLRADAENLIADLRKEEGVKHSLAEAEAMQARLGKIVDRLNAIRIEADQLVPAVAEEAELS